MMLATVGLSKYFPIRGTLIGRMMLKAVDDVSIKIQENRIVGLVGESGSGKSTLGRALLRLLEPTSGDVLFNIPDEELAIYERAQAANDTAKLHEIREKYSLLRKSTAEMRRLRREMNIVFQDPYSSLNPRMRLVDVISEPMLSTGFCTRDEADERVFDLLRDVGLPRFFEDRYPHELSGGQRQRVAIARAISTYPKLLILDEPTSALDVSVQAQILNLLRGLRDKYGISMLLITHNVAVVAYLAAKVYVMYAGKIMEWGDRDKVLRDHHAAHRMSIPSEVSGGVRDLRVDRGGSRGRPGVPPPRKVLRHVWRGGECSPGSGANDRHRGSRRCGENPRARRPRERRRPQPEGDRVDRTEERRSRRTAL